MYFTSQLNVLASLVFVFFYWPTQHVGLSWFFLLANSTCWPISLFLFFYRPTQRVGLSLSFFLLANSTCWPFSFFFFTGQLNVLAFLGTARWISSALVTRFLTCSGNTSWGVGHWQQQETWHRPIPRACMHSQAKPDQPFMAHAKSETIYQTFCL